MSITQLEEELALSGFVRLWHPDNVMIVYEQKLDNCEFLPIHQHGLYKFTFDLGNLRYPKDIKTSVTYEEFVSDIKEYMQRDFQVTFPEDEDTEVPKSWYVSKLIETEKKSMRKYQFRF